MQQAGEAAAETVKAGAGAGGSAAPEAVGGVGESLRQAGTDARDLADFAGELLLVWGVRVVGVIVLLIATWFVASWARRSLFRVLNRPSFDQTLLRFFCNALRWVILAMGLVGALSIFGIAPTSLAAVVGAVGLAVGLALQGSLSNLAAGIMLLLLRPFRVGDVVKFGGGELGKVDEIELFHTKVDTLDNRRLIVPNGQIFGSVIENFTHHLVRRIDIPVGVEYGADLDKTRAALTRAIERIPGRVEDPKSEAVLTGLGASSVDWQVRVWCKTAEFGIVRQATVWACKTALDEAGISIPFPQTEVWMREYAKPEGLAAGGRSRLDGFPPPFDALATAEPDPD